MWDSSLKIIYIMTTRTRFAPSPTGYLHVGGARTALFSYLLARSKQGKFILRIEDTDLERSSDASVKAILDGMAWLGLDWDEGPIFQTDRFARYREIVEQLLAENKAYHCCCSKERLEQLRERQMAAGVKPRYDGKCRTGGSGDTADSVVRFRNPKTGEVEWDDLVRGLIKISNDELDDLIIARPDGSPTYNFTVVVDDIDMRITDVIRGDDHINNTPRQINIYHALGAKPPAFGHVPMILGEDGARLSKRHGAVGVTQYRDDGYLPEALLNYLVRLGWSHGDEEIFSLDEMIALFKISDVNKKPSGFNTEKLNWLNQHWMRCLPVEQVATALAYQFKLLGIDLGAGPKLADIVPVQVDRVKTLKEMAEQSRVFFEDFTEFDASAAKKNLRPVSKAPLIAIRAALEAVVDWNPEALQKAIDNTAEKMDLKMGKIAQPLRVAINGNGVSPSIDKTLWLVGKKRCLQRIDMALEYISRREAAG